MTIQKADAVVIQKRNFRETSLIVNFYTKEFGKISGLMKGIRKDPKKFASTVEVFSHNQIVFYMKNTTSLYLVGQCDCVNNFSGARSDIPRIGAATIMMDLLDSLMQPEDKNEEIFDLVLTCLKELETNYNPEKILTIFKIKMLALSGFKPHFDSCVSCGDRIMGTSKFSLSLGGLLCPQCFRKDLSARAIFRGTIASILHIERSSFSSTLNLGLNPQIKKELDLILNAFLNFHLGRDLRSQSIVSRMEPVLAR